MKFALKILPKPEVLDSQGRTLRNLLKSQGFDLRDCHVGKYIILEVHSDDPESGKKQVQSMVEKGLYNPLIETCQMEKL